MLSAYIDREMTGEEAYLMREHISQCASCELEFEELRRVKHILSTLPSVEPSDDLLDQVKATVFADDAAPSISKKGIIVSTSMAAAMLFLTFALMQWIQVRQGGTNGLVPADEMVATDVRTVGDSASGAPVYMPVNLASAPE
ncbi:MAG: zf-HC2 domain-containing protein [Fimbriimonadaceae bacterium]|nr:MAG: zf-HC2 domain-containing protein [Fimbriimonadaceae bacterium]